jgi:hypothetical protein
MSSSSPSSSSSLTVSQNDAQKKKSTLLIAGFGGGFLQAGIFNPWDRALYLSIKNQQPFLSKENFAKPWAGVSQTIFQRALSSGMYFPLEEIFADKLINSGQLGTNSNEISQNRRWIALGAGLLAGTTNGIIMNPIAAIKYNFWGKNVTHVNRSFMDACKEMYKRGGIRIYFVGVTATVGRDLVFGGIYGLLRHEMTSIVNTIKIKRQQMQMQMQKQSHKISSSDQEELLQRDIEREYNNTNTNKYDSREVLQKPSFAVNLIAATVATVASSPWNYVRNIHYATRMGHKPESAWSIMSNLWALAMKEKTILGRVIHLQTQLRVGWGTARVGCGMAFTNQVYSFVCRQMG